VSQKSSPVELLGLFLRTVGLCN